MLVEYLFGNLIFNNILDLKTDKNEQYSIKKKTTRKYFNFVFLSFDSVN